MGDVIHIHVIHVLPYSRFPEMLSHNQSFFIGGSLTGKSEFCPPSGSPFPQNLETDLAPVVVWHLTFYAKSIVYRGIIPYCESLCISKMCAFLHLHTLAIGITWVFMNIWLWSIRLHPNVHIFTFGYDLSDSNQL